MFDINSATKIASVGTQDIYMTPGGEFWGVVDGEEPEQITAEDVAIELSDPDVELVEAAMPALDGRLTKSVYLPISVIDLIEHAAKETQQTPLQWLLDAIHDQLDEQEGLDEDEDED